MDEFLSSIPHLRTPTSSRVADKIVASMSQVILSISPSNIICIIIYRVNELQSHCGKEFMLRGLINSCS